MSNGDVGSGGFGLPGDVVAQHGVEGCDHLSVKAKNLFATLSGVKEPRLLPQLICE